MGQVTLTVNGTPYQVNCHDGEEARLEQLAVVIDEKVVELSQSLGRIGESKLMLMAALLLLDEAAELNQQLPSPEELSAQASDVDQAAEVVTRIAAALESA